MKPRSRRNARFWRTLQAMNLQTLDLQFLTCNDCGSGGASPAVRKDHLRRPQRPEFSGTRRSASFEKPSRRFTLENRRSPPALPQSPAGQCISRLHCENFALRPNQSQRKTIVELCRNCGGWDFFVEREGKPGKNFFHACVGRTLLSAALEFAGAFSQ